MFLAASIYLFGSASITFAHPAAPLKTLVPKLAEATGLNLAVAKEMQWSVVFVDVSDVSTEDLLAKIAASTYGTWQTDREGKRVLAFDRAALDRKIAGENAEFEKRLRISLKNKSTEGATATGIYRLLERIGPANLSNLPMYKRIVYSDRPNKVQRHLAIDPETTARAVADSNRHAALLASRAKPPETPQLTEAKKLLDPEYWEMMAKAEALRTPKVHAGAPAASLLIVTKQYGSISAVLKVFGQDGSIIGHAEAPVSASDERSDDLSHLLENKTKPDPRPAIKVSADTRDVLTYWRDRQLSPDLKKRLLSFPTTDPFLEAYTDLLKGYNAKDKQDVVLMILEEDENFEGFTPAQVESWLNSFSKVINDGGWVTNLPFDSFVNVDRDAFASALARMREKKSYVFEDYAFLAAQDFITSPFRKGEPMFAPAFEWKFPPDVAWDILGLRVKAVSKDLLRVYGRLSSTEQERMKKGGAIPFTSLAPASRNELEHLAYMADGALSTYREPEGGGLDHMSIMRRHIERAASTTGWLMEPTLTAPDGLAPSTFGMTTGEKILYRLPNNSYKDETLDSYLGADLPLGMLVEIVNYLQNEGRPIPEDILELPSNKISLHLRITKQAELNEDHVRERTAPIKKKINDLGEQFQNALAESRRLAKQFEAYQKARNPGGSSNLKSDPPPGTR